jgi:putative cell wall-binding protein
MVVAAAATICASTFAASGSVSAATTTDRTSGADRFATAVEVAKDFMTCNFVIANGYKSPDALTASVWDRPILLTDTATLNPTTKAYLDKLQGTSTTPGVCYNSLDITIVGGVDVVSNAQFEALDASYDVTVRRLAGADRYATALAVGTAFRGAGPKLMNVIIASGADANYSDSLAGGPVAARSGIPILLNNGATLRADVEKWIVDNVAGNGTVWILGGTDAVPAAVETYLKAAYAPPLVVTRLAGADRAATAATIQASAVTPVKTEVVLANGWDNDGADALAAGPWANDLGILLTQANSLPAATAAALAATCPTKIWVVGGESAVSKAVLDAAVAKATCGASGVTSAKLTNSDVKQGSIALDDNLSAKAKAGGAADGSQIHGWFVEFDTVTDAPLTVTVCTAASTTVGNPCNNSFSTNLPRVQVIANNFSNYTYALLKTAWDAASGQPFDLVIAAPATGATVLSGPAQGATTSGTQDSTVVVTFDKKLVGAPVTMGLYLNYGTTQLLAPVPGTASADGLSATYVWNDAMPPYVPGGAFNNIRFAPGTIVPVIGVPNATPVWVVVSP